MSRRAVVFHAWGETFVSQAAACVRESLLPDCPIYLFTDHTTPVAALPSRVQVVRRPYQFSGKERKSEFFATLPEDFETVLFLDVDTRVVGDVSLGFEKAELHGIAMTPAPHYSLEDFRGFRSVMVSEGVTPQGQVVYNSGVVFFSAHQPEVRSVFKLALSLAQKYPVAPWGDQTYLTLAMEMLHFNPYSLSPSFNHRGFGELISGSVRIWHSYAPVPLGVDHLEPGYLHRFANGRIQRALKVPL